MEYLNKQIEKKNKTKKMYISYFTRSKPETFNQLGLSNFRNNSEFLEPSLQVMRRLQVEKFE